MALGSLNKDVYIPAANPIWNANVATSTEEYSEENQSGTIGIGFIKQ